MFVSKDKHLVVYDEGNLFSAPRAWWMLKQFGVEKVIATENASGRGSMCGRGEV
jgi:3-mercaptopyruvate sulfurtransferase SseA